jgi:hypothetical protein
MPQSMNRRSLTAAIGAAAVAIPIGALAVTATSAASLAVATSPEADMRRLWHAWLECWPPYGEADDKHDRAEFAANAERDLLARPWEAYSVNEHREGESGPFRVTLLHHVADGVVDCTARREVMVEAPDMLSALRTAKAVHARDRAV